MKKYETIKEHQEFEYIIHNCAFKNSKNFVIYNKDNDYNYPRFGIAVGKKLGNAVIRNRSKRIMRELIHKNKKLFKNRKDYIIIIKKGFIERTFNELNNEMINLLK